MRRGRRMRFRRDRWGLSLSLAAAVTLVALVLAAVVAPPALHLLEDAQPVLSGDQVDVLARGNPADRVDEQRIAAGVRGNTAAAAEHVEADADMLRADEVDHVVDVLRPLVRR